MAPCLLPCGSAASRILAGGQGSDFIDSAVLSDGAAVYRQALGMLGEVRGGSKKYYNADSLGSTRAVVNSAGTVSATRETDAFGNVWTPGTTGMMATPFGFAGQHGYQADADSGLMRLGHRYYDASTGRFLSRDPIRDGNNWYAYCENDPVNAIDPEGLQGVVLGPPSPETDVVLGPPSPKTDEEKWQDILKDLNEEGRRSGIGKDKKKRLEIKVKGKGEIKKKEPIKEAEIQIIIRP